MRRSFPRSALIRGGFAVPQSVVVFVIGLGVKIAKENSEFGRNPRKRRSIGAKHGCVCERGAGWWHHALVVELLSLVPSS